MAFNFPLDEKLERKINSQRIAEEERKRRIFNEKIRKIGLDVNALNYQVHEKMFLKNKENEMEKHIAEEMKRQSDLAEIFEQEYKKEIKKISQKLDNFRLSCQRPEYRREFDLYDPHQLKKERPPRISDHDVCPVSSLQKLEGEDLNYKNRLQKQKEQVRDLLCQQIHAKKMQEQEENKVEKDWETWLLNQDLNAAQIAKEEKENMKRTDEKLKSCNKSMFEQSKERQLQEKFNDDYEKRKDIETAFYSDLLTENPLVARSTFGPHRVITDRWKGMSKDQLDEYYKGQVQQIIDKKNQNLLEQYEAAKWNEIMQNQDSNAALEKEQEEKKKNEHERKLAEENLELAHKQRINQEYMNSIVYSNAASDEFFSQFNTSSR